MVEDENEEAPQKVAQGGNISLPTNHLPVGTVIPFTTDGPQPDGCNWSQKWIANYEDGCGNKATPIEIVYTWGGRPRKARDFN